MGILNKPQKDIAKMAALISVFLLFSAPIGFTQSEESKKDKPVAKDESKGLSKDQQQILDNFQNLATDYLKAVGTAGLEVEKTLKNTEEEYKAAVQTGAGDVTVVPAPGEVKDYLLKFREISDKAAPSSEEKVEVITATVGLISNAGTKSLDGIVNKCALAIEAINRLVPANECKDIHQLGIKFFQINKEFYTLLKKPSKDRTNTDLQRIQALSEKMKETGIELDKLRNQLHQKYGLGRL